MEEALLASEEAAAVVAAVQPKNWDLVVTFAALLIVKQLASKWHFNILKGVSFLYPLDYKNTPPASYNSNTHTVDFLRKVAEQNEMEKMGVYSMSVIGLEPRTKQIELPESVWVQVPVANNFIGHGLTSKCVGNAVGQHFLKNQSLYAVYENCFLLALSSILAHVLSLFTRCLSESGKTSSWASVFPAVLTVSCLYGNLKCYASLEKRERWMSMGLSVLITASALWTLLSSDSLLPKIELWSYINLVFSSFWDFRLDDKQANFALIVSLVIAIYSLSLGLVPVIIRSAQLFKGLVLPGSESSNEGVLNSGKKKYLILGAVLPIFLAVVYSDRFWSYPGDDANHTSFLGISMAVRFKALFQLMCLAIWSFIQLRTLGLYLQKYLFAVGSLINTNGARSEEINLSIVNRARMIIPFAFQMVSTFLLPLGIAFVLYRYSYSAHNFGLCKFCRVALSMPPRVDHDDTLAQQSAQIAILSTGPYMSNLWESLIQISTKENNWVGVVRGFLVKVSYMYPPTTTTVTLLQTFICGYFTIWSGLFFASLGGFIGSKSSHEGFSGSGSGSDAKAIKKD